jgi:hypothetical protein
MTRTDFTPVFALVFTLAGTACSAAATCDARQNAYDAPLIETEARTGSILLSEQNDSQTVNFRATLSDLPEQWSSDGLVQIGGLQLDLSLRYESEPIGGDGHTEMPRLALTFKEPAAIDSSTVTTSNYPGPTPFLYSPSLFEDCTPGARQCESTRPVRIERLDGAPFPPVRVSFRATANARIPTCEKTSSARATLDVEIEAQ